MKKTLLVGLGIVFLAGHSFGWTASLNALVFSGPANNPLEASTYPLVNAKVIFSVSHQTPDGKVVEEWAGSDLTDNNGIATFNKEIKKNNVTKVVYSVMVKSGEQISSSKDCVIIKPSGGNFTAGFILVSLGPNGGLPTTTTTTTTTSLSLLGGGSPEMNSLFGTVEVRPVVTSGSSTTSLSASTSTLLGTSTTTMFGPSTTMFPRLF